jgi:hypothetical protein
MHWGRIRVRVSERQVAQQEEDSKEEDSTDTLKV